MLRIDELEAQVNALKAVVEKQSQLIAQTGQQLLDLQVNNVRSRMNNMQVDLPQPAAAVDPDDFVTNEDIVQLVGELQGQLDLLEDRTINRAYNSQLAQGSAIAPLHNRDGEQPPVDLFPLTVAQFEALDPLLLVLLAEFYDLAAAPPPASIDNAASMQEAQQILNHQQSLPLEERIGAYSEEQLKELKSVLGRFLGLQTLS